MMNKISGVLSDKGLGQLFFIKKGDGFKYSVDLSEDFDGICKFVRTINGGQSYEVISYISSDVTDVLVSDGEGSYAIQVDYDPEETSLTGTATFSFSGEALSLEKWINNNGEIVFEIDEDGVSESRVSKGVGSVSTAGITVKEYGSESLHKTVLTLNNVALPVVSVADGRGVGGVKIYDFPSGYINNFGCISSLSIGVGDEDDFTDATPEGDIGVGTVLPANADALGTDATDDNFGTATAFTMDAYAASANIPPEALAVFDGTSSAISIFLNAAVDAADIDDDVTANLIVSGTITINWSNLGDF